MPKGKLTFRTREENPDISRTRAMSVTLATRDDGSCEMSFSSTAEIEIWPGEFEVLSHAPGACDMSRMQGSGMLLFNHNRNFPLGRIDSIRIDADGIGRCVIPKEMRSQSDAAQQIWKDIDSGVLRNTSVGYRVLAYSESKRENGTMLFTVTKWQPSEVSVVTIPADISTGVDRSENTTTQNAENTNMPRNNRYSRRFMEPDNGNNPPGSSPGTPPAPVTPPVVSVETERATGATGERQRVSSIIEACRKFNAPEIQTRAISEGLGLEEVRGLLLDHVQKGNQNLRQASSAMVGLTPGEAQAFSFVKLLRALSAGPGENSVREAAKFELEACTAASDAMKHRSAKGTVIPIDVLLSQMDPNFSGRRDVGLNISATGIDGGTGTGSAAIKQHQLLVSSFIEILRNRCVAMNLGTELTGLVGNFDIPKMTSSQFGGGWLGSEDAAAPQTGLDFGLIPITPKTAAAYSYITRKMLTQPSIGVEALVRMDIAKKIAQVVDLAAFYGDGTGQSPTGVKEATGIHAVDFAAVNPTYAELVEMETRIAVDNADVDSMAYVSNARFRGFAKTALKFPGTAASGTIWEGGSKAGSVNGYRTEITNQITTGDIFFGNFADMILGLWGGLELIVDPYTHSTKGGIIISAFQDVDVALRRVASFSFGQKPA